MDLKLGTGLQYSNQYIIQEVQLGSVRCMKLKILTLYMVAKCGRLIAKQFLPIC